MTKQLILTTIISFLTLSNVHSIELPRINPVPGGVALIELDKTFTKNSKVYFQKKRVLTIQNKTKWLALVGIPLKTKPGKFSVSIVSKNEITKKKYFTVNAKEYETRHITIKNKRMVSPSKKDIERHYKEKPLMLAALKTWSENDDITTKFLAPVEGRFSSIFGLKRIYNNQKRIRRHTGLDIAAPTGTAITSPAKATVIRTGSYFFTGNTVFLDHGQGLVTMYCHLNKIQVKAGQRLEQGQQIGTVGMTGRVSGPHLHWVVSLNNTKVDPKLFIKHE